MNTHWSRSLRRLGACQGIIEWAEQYPTLAEAWEKCRRGERMLWLAGYLSGLPLSDQRKPLALAAAACVSRSIEASKGVDIRAQNALDIATLWATAEKQDTPSDFILRAAAQDAANAAAAGAMSAFGENAFRTYANSFVCSAAVGAVSTIYSPRYTPTAAAAATAVANASLFCYGDPSAVKNAGDLYSESGSKYETFDVLAGSPEQQEFLEECANLIRIYFPKPPELP